MSNGELQVVGGPPITLDDGRVVGFGESFDIDELADDDLLKALLASNQIVFVEPDPKPDPKPEPEDDPEPIEEPED